MLFEWQRGLQDLMIIIFLLKYFKALKDMRCQRLEHLL